jgi:hypothetical protein
MRWKLLVLMVVLCAPARAEDANSANFLLQHCGNRDRTPYLAGVCDGIIDTLVFTARAFPEQHRSCAPERATVRQATQVVVKYINERPQRWHENFKMLASEALQKTWPCKVACAKLYDRKTPITAADLLNDRVIPLFESNDVGIRPNPEPVPEICTGR